MSSIKPIKIWGKGSVNPRKVTIILEELGLPYEIIDIPFSDVKKPEYVAINPNGRLPAIYDPNSDVTLWESGAIVEYLIERYDKAHNLGFAPGTAESYHARQWFFFQATGQGPYYGQLSWFKRFHPEKLPSAIDRYLKELNRVTGVLEDHLARQEPAEGGDGPWLVGGKLSYADLAFIPYQLVMPEVFLGKDEYDVDGFPHVKEWLRQLISRQSVLNAYGGSVDLK